MIFKEVVFQPSAGFREEGSRSRGDDVSRVLSDVKSLKGVMESLNGKFDSMRRYVGV